MASSYTAVVGIDFGTGGYAIAIGYKQSTWIVSHETLRHRSVQKNSAHLLGKAEFNTSRFAEGDIEFCQLGYNARSIYADLPPEERVNYVLFPSAKMSLYEMNSEEARATSVNGATAPASDIIRMALAQIHSEAIKSVSSLSDVLWVITVPAIWSDAAKQIMRNAANKAGIPDKNLIFALEPETASIACRMSPGRECSIEPLDTKSSYMVIDAGKGTVDITVHQVQNDRLSDVTIPRGDACGSGVVDEMFSRLLNDCFSAEAMDDFKNAMPNEWLEIMTKFEHLKCHGDINDGRMKSLELGNKFLFHVRNAVDETNSKIPEGVSIYDRFATLDMSPEAVQSLFQPSLDRVYELVSEILADPNVEASCKTVFLVGGYASCPFLHSTVKSAIDNAHLKMDIIRPLEPALAVVRGAVMYGLDPTVLSARMQPHTIAVAVTVPFDPALHSGKQVIEIEGKQYCTDALDVLVRKGQRTKSDQIVEHVYTPLIAERHIQNVSVVQIFHFSKEDIKYAGEEDVRLAGELVVKLPSEVDSDQIRVRLCFGSTETKASASIANGMPVECSLDFLSVGSRLGHHIITVDICFVMDCTGSMAAYIEAAKDQLVAIGNSVIKQLSNRDEVCTLRFAFIGYRDFCDAPQDRLQAIDFTADFFEVRKFIARQDAFGGGDGPEDLLGGLNHAASLNWNAKNRFIVISADAPCHGVEFSGTNSGDAYPEGNPDGLTAEAVFDKISSLNAQLLFTKITSFTDLMVDKFQEKHPITEIDMPSTNCINQFGRSLTSEIVGYIKRHATY